MTFGTAFLLLLQATAPAAVSANPAAPAPQTQTKAQIEAQAKEYFRKLDLNRDGKVDRAEADKANAAAQAEFQTAAFARLDLNKDGVLSREEFGTALARPGGRNLWFDSNDIDKNGKVELNEAIARAQRNFERLDADNNGVLSSDELQALRGRQRRR